MADTAFYSIIDYTVDDATTQQALIDGFAELQERWVCFYPGYRSARLFASVDGSRVINVVEWSSEAEFRHFEQTSDGAGRAAAIDELLKRLEGKARPRMSGPPRYRLAREVVPGSQRLD